MGWGEAPGRRTATRLKVGVRDMGPPPCRGVKRGILASCVAVALLMAAASAAAQTPALPGGSATITAGPVNASGVAGVSIGWSVDCPYPAGQSPSLGRPWGVQVVITNAGGKIVNSDSAAYGGGTSADTYGANGNPNNEDHPLVLVVTMDPAKPSPQTFQVAVTLQCNGMDTTVDNKTIHLTRCGASPYNDAQREYDLYSNLADTGERQLAEGQKGLKEFVKDYAKESVKVTAEKATLLTALKRVVSHAPVLIVEVAAALAGLSITAEEADLAWQDYARLTDGAQSDFKQADGFLDRANADLAEARGEGTACAKPLHDQLDKLLAEQKHDDDARDLIDGWEHHGDLYVSPISGGLVNEETAIKQARAALTNGQATTRASLATTATASVDATAAQLRSAISEINSALDDEQSVEADVGRLEAATTALLGGLNALPPA